MNKISESIYTGSKINRPSDSPDGTAKLLRLNTAINNSNTYVKNVNEGLAQLQETTNSMESMFSSIQDVRSLLVEIQNPSNSPYLESYAIKIDSALESMLNMANHEYNGKFLFGGTDHSTKPYGLKDDGTGIELKTSSVSGSQSIKISGTISTKINITGEELFGTVGADDIFNTLYRIREDLKAGNMPNESDKQKVETFNNNLLNKISYAGNITNRLYDCGELLNNSILSLQDLMSKETEVDMAKAVVDLEYQENLMQLAYKTSSMVLPKSLLDYL
jgi:flagellar hook-associated protein 3 FlgL